MKYTLVLGIEYTKYKKPGTVEVSMNDLLIDSFQLNVDHPAMKTVPSLEKKWLLVYNKIRNLGSFLRKNDPRLRILL